MKSGILAVILSALAFAGCSNFFHELIPPDENRILTFNVEHQTEIEDIYEREIIVVVSKTVDIKNIIPRISISHKAKIIPVTNEYMQAAFPGMDIEEEIANVYMKKDMTSHLHNLIKQNPDFNVPALDIPIDFTYPVDFIVISGQGTIRQYTVRIEIDTGAPRLLNFSFAKYDNGQLTKDAPAVIDEIENRILTEIYYPAETQVSFALKPSFRILGDRLEVKGKQIISRQDAIQFNKTYSIQELNVRIYREGETADFTLFAAISEDPVGVRDMIDFRFEHELNPGVVLTAVSDITHSGDSGTIKVNVYYLGAEPNILRPTFTAPGDVFVDGYFQTSGVQSHDFSQYVEYKVVSKLNTERLYVVSVHFENAATYMPRFTSFGFSSVINTDLSTNTEAEITENSTYITVEVPYKSIRRPEVLIPSFEFLGESVQVDTMPQTSGVSRQDFSHEVKYTVVSVLNPSVKRDYWIHVTFVRDTSSDSSITYFSFHPDDNPDANLREELTGKIDQSAKTITVYAPVDSGITSVKIFPRFESSGKVYVGNDQQTSGTSWQIFNSPAVYKSVSANEMFQSVYTVTVLERRSKIYVDANAAEDGDGFTWERAYRRIEDAIASARTFDPDIEKEIWIAKGTYTPGDSPSSFYQILDNTSYIGGFAGYETSKYARNTALNKTIISGDLENGEKVNTLFGSFNVSGTYISYLYADVTFDGLTIKGARGNGNQNYSRGYSGGICAHFGSSSAQLTINDCKFDDLRGENGSAVYTYNGKIKITNTDVTNTAYNGVAGDSASYYSGAIYIYNAGELSVDNISIDKTQDQIGIHISSWGIIEIANSVIKNCTATSSYGGGIYIHNDSSKAVIKNLTLENNKAKYGGGIYKIGGNNSNGENTGALEIIDTLIKDCYAGENGGGIFVGSQSKLIVKGSTFDNSTARDQGGAIYFYWSGSPLITDTTFLNCTSRGRYKILYQGDSAVIKNCTFTHDNKLTNTGSTTPRSMFEKTGTFENCTFNNLNFNGGQSFIFDSHISFGGLFSGDSISGGGNLILKNNVFNLKNSAAGLIRVYCGQKSGSFLFVSWSRIEANFVTLDGNTINDNTLNSENPLIYNRVPSGSAQSVNKSNVRVKKNNYYNGKLMSSSSAWSNETRPYEIPYGWRPSSDDEKPWVNVYSGPITMID